MRGVYYRTEKDGTPLATPELRISATNNRTVYYDNQNAKEAALQNDEIKEGSIVLTGYADGESEVVIKQQPDWQNAIDLTAAQVYAGYTAPDNGLFICSGVYTNGQQVRVTINGIEIARAGYNSGSDYNATYCNCVVNKGDVVKFSINAANKDTIAFVPFKTVAEPLTLPVNVVPENNKYLYTEVKTNKIWVDGKPIYRKVVSLPTAKAVNDTAYINLDITFPNDADTMFLPEAVSSYGDLLYYGNYKPIRAACKVSVTLPAGTNFILEYTKN